MTERSQLQDQADKCRRMQEQLDTARQKLKEKTDQRDLCLAEVDTANAKLRQAEIELNEIRVFHGAALSLVAIQVDSMQELCRKAHPYGLDRAACEGAKNHY